MLARRGVVRPLTPAPRTHVDIGIIGRSEIGKSRSLCARSGCSERVRELFVGLSAGANCSKTCPLPAPTSTASSITLRSLPPPARATASGTPPCQEARQETCLTFTSPPHPRPLLKGREPLPPCAGCAAAHRSRWSRRAPCSLRLSSRALHLSPALHPSWLSATFRVAAFNPRPAWLYFTPPVIAAAPAAAHTHGCPAAAPYFSIAMEP